MFKKEEKKAEISEELQKELNENLIVIDSISKVYSNGLEAVHNLSVTIKEGDFVVLVGPSGCGKSTTLRMIAGLEDITAGNLYINGEIANKKEPKERGVSMVFQSYALYPHYSVYQNMAFGLSGLSKAEIDARIKRASEMLGLTEYLDRKPTALSGGQCQRVALGRAIVRESPIFLLDEPLSNLDAKLRVQMRSEIIKLHEKLHNTIIYVTHDQVEAMTMATKLVIMDKGKVQQVGTPKDIYDKPVNSFVATFIGSPAMNVFEAKSKEGSILLEDGQEIKLQEESRCDFDAFYSNELKLLNEEIDFSNKTIDSLKTTPKHKRDDSYKSLIDANEKNISTSKEKIEQIESEKDKEIKDILIGFRPEDISLEDNEGYKFEAFLDVKELLGAEYQLRFAIGETSFLVYAPFNTGFQLKTKEEYTLNLPLKSLRIFDGITGKAIS